MGASARDWDRGADHIGAVAAPRFFFKVTHGRPEVVRHLTLVRQPRRLPNILSPDVPLQPDGIAATRESEPDPEMRSMRWRDAGHICDGEMGDKKHHRPNPAGS